LPAAREEIGRLLLQRGRTAWAREECAATLEDSSLYRSAPETLYLRVRGHDRLGRRTLAVLRELAILRDQIARQEDVPPRTLLTDGVLRALARRPVRTVDDLDAVSGLPRPVERQHGREIVAATQRALALPQDRLPPMEPPETPALLRRVEAVWPAIQRRCLEAGVAPSLVAAKKEVARLCQAPVAGQPPGPSRLLQGWRKELLGNLLESLR
jgi:ribonuclease D